VTDLQKESTQTPNSQEGETAPRETRQSYEFMRRAYFWAFDFWIKTLPKHERVVSINVEEIRDTPEILVEKAADYEFVDTVFPGLMKKNREQFPENKEYDLNRLNYHELRFMAKNLEGQYPDLAEPFLKAAETKRPKQPSFYEVKPPVPRDELLIDVFISEVQKRRDLRK